MFITKVLAQKKVLVYAFSIVSFLLLSLNLLHTFQYRRGIIHHDSMSKELYFDLFTCLGKQPDGFWDKLKQPQYDRAKKGLDEE